MENAWENGDADIVPDNTFMLHSKIYGRIDHENPHPAFAHAAELMTAWEKLSYPTYSSGLLKQEKREKVKNSKGEIITFQLIFMLRTIITFHTIITFQTIITIQTIITF